MLVPFDILFETLEERLRFYVDEGFVLGKHVLEKSLPHQNIQKVMLVVGDLVQDHRFLFVWNPRIDDICCRLHDLIVVIVSLVYISDSPSQQIEDSVPEGTGGKHRVYLQLGV